MPSRWTSYTLAVAVTVAPAAGAAAEQGKPAEAVEQALPAQDLAHPPPGSPADQALWRSGLEVTQAVQIERARATRLQTVLLNLRYTERLQALTARGGADAEKGQALQRRLGDAHARQFSVLTARWPVDTVRVCGYPAMELGSLMTYEKAEPADLAKHRAMLTGCVEQAQTSVKLMKEGNDALEEAMKAAEDGLKAAGLAAIPAAGPAKAKAEAADTRPAAQPAGR